MNPITIPGAAPGSWLEISGDPGEPTVVLTGPRGGRSKPLPVERDDLLNLAFDIIAELHG